MGLGKALVFFGAALLILLTPGIYVIYPSQVSLITKVILQSYILIFILALVLLAKGIDRASVVLREMRMKRRKERIKAWEIQTLENYYT
jgi:hypothetical protein